MLVITGVAGFIGSCLAAYIGQNTDFEIIGVDDFGAIDKNRNLLGKEFSKLIHREDFPDWLEEHGSNVTFVFHLGARTDTTSKDPEVFERLNLNYSKRLFHLCTDLHIPLAYASSAATYGLGEHGYEDDHETVDKLAPLNLYGQSKQDFDQWVLDQEDQPPHWYGFKFFNVYGPNEYHKGRMASVVFHAFNQITETGKMNLFRSHREDIEDGYQSRDFIYVKDVIDVMWYFYQSRPHDGLYNLGTGKARTFLDLVKAVFSAMDKTERIEFIDTPEDIRETYQYFTEADTNKLRKAGYEAAFTSLESGIKEYVQRYLMDGKYY